MMASHTSLAADLSHTTATRIDTDNLCNFVVGFLYSKHAMSRQTFNEIRQIQRRTERQWRVVQLCCEIDDPQTARDLLDSLMTQPLVLSLSKHVQQQGLLQPKPDKSVGPSPTTNPSTGAPEIHGKSTVHLYEGNFINGIASVEDRIYLVRGATVEVYNDTTFCLLDKFTIPNLRNASCMAGSEAKRCLFVMDTKERVLKNSLINALAKLLSKSKVFRIEPNPVNISQWAVGEAADMLSVTSAATVLVACPHSRQLREFTDDGQRIRTVHLHKDVLNPYYAILLASGEFLVNDMMTEKEPSCLCVVYAADRSPPSKVYRDRETLPFQMAVNSKGLIFFSDVIGRRIVVLDSSLKYLYDIQTDAPVSVDPCDILLDESRDRLFVIYDNFDDVNDRHNFVDVIHLDTSSR